MSRNQLVIVRDLIRTGIVTEHYDMTNGHRRKMLHEPELCQRVVEYTSFLQYNAPLTIRVQCIIKGITEQHYCETCGTLVHMRDSGRFRYTFPSFCSQKCSASNEMTIIKKRLTNNRKYGVTNILLNK